MTFRTLAQSGRCCERCAPTDWRLRMSSPAHAIHRPAQAVAESAKSRRRAERGPVGAWERAPPCARTSTSRDLPLRAQRAPQRPALTRAAFCVHLRASPRARRRSRVLGARLRCHSANWQSCPLLASQAPPGPAAVSDPSAGSSEPLRSGSAAASAVRVLFLAALVERALSRRPVVCSSSESRRLSNAAMRSSAGSMSRRVSAAVRTTVSKMPSVPASIRSGRATRFRIASSPESASREIA